MQHRLQQAAGFGLRRTQAGFQLVAKSHQLIDLGDDALLLGEWGKGKTERGKASASEMLNANASEVIRKSSTINAFSKCIQEEIRVDAF